MFYGGLAAALLTLGITVYVFIKLNIRHVLTDLTGIKWKTPSARRTAAQETESLRRTTSEIKLKKQNLAGEEITELMSQEVAATALLQEEKADETMLLSEYEAEETSLLGEEAEETTLLGEELEETTLLTGEEQEPAFYFKKELDIVITHSATKI
jgi:hypothetical protein